MTGQEITSWGSLALALGAALIAWMPRIGQWVTSSRDRHYDDLRGFIEKLELRIEKTEQNVEKCEERHHETQRQFSEQMAASNAQMQLVLRQNEALLTKGLEEKLITQAIAESMKSHPALLEALKKDAEKE